MVKAKTPNKETEKINRKRLRAQSMQSRQAVEKMKWEILRYWLLDLKSWYSVVFIAVSVQVNLCS